ncbi:MAG: family 43 glycosylhydrolase [Oscillospiraceae bacterium]|nr:family 43 glycosylhydrolase [Oscillospiraceae bacterium]
MQITRKKSVQKISAGVLATAMLLGMGAFFPERKQIELDALAVSSVIVDTSKEYQTIRGFGGIDHPEWTGSNLTDSQKATAFGNGDNQLGFNVLRVYVNDDRTKWYKELETAKYVKQNGGVVFATPWNPPADMCETFTRTYTTWDGQTATQENQKRLRHDKYAEYAQHLNDFVLYMRENGVELDAISIQNEPDYGEEWTWMSEEECVEFLANYADKIDCPVMSPESFSYNKSYYNAILNNSKAYANTDLFGTHFYGTSRNNMDFPTLETSGKEIWMTEVYVPNSSSDADTWPEAIDVSENIHNGLVVGNMNAYVWWYIRRSYGPMKEDGNISKRGYCMAQYSKYVRPGDIRVDATEQPADNVFVSAYKGDDNQVTIVAVNKSTETYTQDFSITDEKISQVDRYRTSANENLAETLNLEYTDNHFFAQLPAESVSTFVVTLSGQAEEPNEFGWYFDDGFEGTTCNWTSRGGAEIITSGRTAYVGSEALLVQNRTDSWNGASKKLSTNAFVAGNAYSFSANVIYFDGDATDKFYLKLQYTDANGDTKYTTIAETTAVKGEWVQLANTNYKIPDGAKDLQIYVETAETTNNFYIDEVIGAVAGTTIIGAGKPTVISSIKGDVNGDGLINIYDLVLAKNGIKKGFANSSAETVADVDENGVVDIADIKQIQDYLHGRIKHFTVVEKSTVTVDKAKMEQIFSSVTPTASYKKDGENNPLFTQRFGADPGVMEYNGRVYVYTTNDVIEYDANGNVTENTYGLVNKINCISSDDMVNWTDHGAIEVAGQNGVAKWATCSWAPCAAHKTINGKEKFFLYFCNGGNGVSVLTADSPTGPWTDPLGKALITRDVPNCSNILWLFDPAVFVDDDGTGYLCFGGGVPEGKTEMPSTSRVVKLGDDMISLAGDPVTIDAPYLFEDSGINKIGNKYYYTYCSNWNTGGNRYGLTSGAIEYMIADNPLGPYTYGGELFKNQGNFFGYYGNNHHSIVELNNQLYLFYHSRPVEGAMGIEGNYRSPQVDVITTTGTALNSVTGTMAGIAQLKKLNPYQVIQAETMSNQSKDISVSGLGNTMVTGQKGSWIKASGLDFSKNTSTLTIKASSENGAAIKICTDSLDGNVIAYAEFPAGGKLTEITVPVDSVTGTKDIYFLFSNGLNLDSWQFS